MNPQSAIRNPQSTEYRLDPISGSWVIIARERSQRPSEYVTQPECRRIEVCPFCAGNEQLTPGAIASYPIDHAQDCSAAWQVRVIANKYPALNESAAATWEMDDGANGWYSVRRGYGMHEVVVESPHHTSSFTELTADQAYWSFAAYRDRLRLMSENPRLAYGLVFKNCRGGAGATLEHTHSQVVGSSLVPSVVQTELRSAAEFSATRGECIFCYMSQCEMDRGERMVAVTPRFAAFCPYAGRFPYECWILPRQHEPRFETAKLDDLGEISRLFRQILRALEKIFPQVPYNYWIHTAPFDRSPYDYYHWHIELVPRITTQAGFEWGSGCFMNPVAPEDAAEAIRRALI